jgi:hypothetical protein
MNQDYINKKAPDTHNWEDWELGMIRMSYDGTKESIRKLARFFGVGYYPVKRQIKAMSLKLPKKESKWQEMELNYLRENWGLKPEEEIARYLHRSIAALHIASVRKLHRSRHKNFIAANNLAKILGVKDPKTVIHWVEKNWLTGERSPVHCGKTLMWTFKDEDIEMFVRDRPWYFKRDAMPESKYRDIIDELYKKDPWYSLEAACKYIGVASISAAMWSYRKKGFLHPIKTPIEGGNHWTWIHLKSDLDNFLKNDPRVFYGLHHSESKKRHRLNRGQAIELCALWKIKCPVCHEPVIIVSRTHVLGSDIIKVFQEECCQNGRCRHKDIYRIPVTMKFYKVHKSSGRKKIFLPNWPDRKLKEAEIKELVGVC